MTSEALVPVLPVAVWRKSRYGGRKFF